MEATRTTGRAPVGDSDRPFRGRRLSWAEFYLMPDLRPANDSYQPKNEAA